MNKQNKSSTRNAGGELLRRVILAFAACLAIFAGNPAIVNAAGDDPAAAVKLYMNIGDIVGRQFVEVDRLKHWREVWLRHSGDIRNNDDALKYAAEGIATLKDPYTRVLHGIEAREITDQLSGRTASTGLKFLISVDKEGNAIKDDKGNYVLNRNKDGLPVVGRVMDNSSAKEAHMKSGDAIETINGKDASKISLMELLAACNGKVGNHVSIGYSRDNEHAQASLVTKDVEIANLTDVMLPKHIGYIRLRSFLPTDTGFKFRRACEDLGGCKALILDLRHNGGGRVESALDVASECLDSGKLVSFKERVEGTKKTRSQVDILNPSSGFLIEEFRMGREKSPYMTRLGVRQPNVTRNVPMIVLVDEKTASGSEIVAAALKQSGRAKLVGTRTFGKGCAQGVNKIPGSSDLVLVTLSKWYMPDGKCLSDAPAKRRGIQPDVECAASDPDLMDKVDQESAVDLDKDEQLKKAYEMLAGQ